MLPNNSKVRMREIPLHRKIDMALDHNYKQSSIDKRIL